MREREGRSGRVAAGLVIAGSVMVLVFRSLHGDLPAADTPAALAFVSEHPFYAGIHVGSVLGALLWVGGLTELIAARRRGGSGLDRAAISIMLVGAAIFALEHSVDGIAGQDLAARWTGADPAGRTSLEIVAETAFAVLRGPSLMGVLSLWGLPVLLLSLELRHAGLPKWVPGAGSVIGGLTVLMALALVPREDVYPGVFLYGLAVSLSQLWILSVGVLAWRGRRLSVSAGAR